MFFRNYSKPELLNKALSSGWTIVCIVNGWTIVSNPWPYDTLDVRYTMHNMKTIEEATECALRSKPASATKG
jgi:hypothetical protein